MNSQQWRRTSKFILQHELFIKLMGVVYVLSYIFLWKAVFPNDQSSWLLLGFTPIYLVVRYQHYLVQQWLLEPEERSSFFIDEFEVWVVIGIFLVTVVGVAVNSAAKAPEVDMSWIKESERAKPSPNMAFVMQKVMERRAWHRQLVMNLDSSEVVSAATPENVPRPQQTDN